MNKTKVLILGVGHSIQLASRNHHPGVFRSFFESVKPDAVCIERSPEKYIKSDYYEFTYEQQYLTIPYALEKDIPIYPIDWLPDLDDQRLLSGISPDHDEPPIIRSKNHFFSFHGCFPYRQVLDFDFFFADNFNDDLLKKDQEWLDRRIPGLLDFSRRLVLYRTFLQAMRIREVAKKHQGQTILVVVGAFHKPDIENILIDSHEVEIIQPSNFGIQNDINQLHSSELHAIATYNLLGIQSKYGVVDWGWIDEVLVKLEEAGGTEEVRLLRTRYQILNHMITNDEAISIYKEIGALVSYEQKLTYHGVKYKQRIDSYFDPFGYLSIKQRIELELAREYNKLGFYSKSQEIKQSILNSKYLSLIQRAQLEGYWDEYVMNMK